MDLKKIKNFIDLAKESNVTKLSFKDKDTQLSVSFEKSVGLQNTISQQSIPLHNQPHSLNEEQTDINGEEITSPLVGTYYESSAPGKPPFVKVGDQVSIGQTLCIVEAMKIMNEIEATTSGKITKILTSNEEFVEYGQVLFIIEP